MAQERRTQLGPYRSTHLLLTFYAKLAPGPGPLL